MQGHIEKLTIIRYRRKSTEGDERQIASLPDQAAALDEMAARLEISASQIFDDVEEAKSAKKPGRMVFNDRVIAALAEGRANAIMCWHADRLSRNAIDTAALVNLMDVGKLNAVITNQQIFWNTPMDKFMLALLCGQAKLENDNKGVNVKRGLAGKVRKGWRPGVAPIGYLNDKTRERGDRTIVVDEERFPLVRRLWDLFLTGQYSVRQLQAISTQQLGLRTRKTRKQGDKSLSLSHVYRILSDPFYYGWYQWANPDTGTSELRKGVHPPMITEEEFRMGQAILGHRQRPQPKVHLFAYTGLIRCGECGSQVTAEEKWQVICGKCKRKFASSSREQCPFCETKIVDMTGKQVLHYIYYHCTKRRNPQCPQRGVRVEELERQIDQELCRFTIGEKYMRWAINALKDERKDETAALQIVDQNSNRNREKLKAERSELNRFIIKQENAGWTLMRKEEVLNERNRIEAELIRTERDRESSDGAPNQWLTSCVHVLDYACHARFWFKEGTIKQKRAIAGALGSNLTLREKTLSTDFTFPLAEIKHMIEIAPVLIGEFEPAIAQGCETTNRAFHEKIPYLLRSTNAIRTYFMSTGATFPDVMASS